MFLVTLDSFLYKVMFIDILKYSYNLCDQRCDHLPNPLIFDSFFLYGEILHMMIHMNPTILLLKKIIVSF